MKKCYALLFFLCLQGCVDFPHGESIRLNTLKLQSQYPNVKHAVKINNKVHTYLHQKNEQSDWLVVFVHGSPGNSNAFAHLLRYKPLLQNYGVIAVDRLGYEKSANTQPERNLKKQAQAIHHIVSIHSADKKVVLVGHSFGGPVIARMAIDYPEIYPRLVMVAASVDPELEKTKWFQIPANWALFRWMVPDALDTSNQEILALKRELVTLNKVLYKNTADVYVIHGTQDKLVPYGNVDYMKKVYGDDVKKIVRLEGVNHFIPWSHSGELIQAVDFFTGLFTTSYKEASQ